MVECQMQGQVFSDADTQQINKVRLHFLTKFIKKKQLSAEENHNVPTQNSKIITDVVCLIHIKNTGHSS